MYKGPEVYQDAIRAFSKLPGIGEKTAQRLVLHLLKLNPQDARRIGQAVDSLLNDLTFCATCHGYTDQQPCAVCRDQHREPGLLCVVEEPADMLAIEQCLQYRGRYHVLHGRLSPLEGIGPEQLRIGELMDRVGKEHLTEVVLATNPDVEGDATALYLGKMLTAMNISISRIAMGIPMGGSLEYTDQVTLARAIAERRMFATSKT